MVGSVASRRLECHHSSKAPPPPPGFAERVLGRVSSDKAIKRHNGGGGGPECTRSFNSYYCDRYRTKYRELWRPIIFVLSNSLLFNQWTKSYIYNCRTMCIHILQMISVTELQHICIFFQMISIPCLQNISIFTDCFQIIISQINNKYKSLWKLLHVHNIEGKFLFKREKQKQKIVPFLPPPPIPSASSVHFCIPPPPPSPYSHLPSPPSHFPPDLC